MNKENMNKDKKCISLPLAKKISELAKIKGIELPESEHKWVEILEKGIEPNWHLVGDDEKPEDYCFVEGDQMGRIIKAFDVSELGEMLPKRLIKKVEYWFNVARMSHGWVVGYVSKKEGILFQEAGITEAEARGLLYYYLMENDLL